jgi:flagellar basal body-associated protein FliL
MAAGPDEIGFWTKFAMAASGLVAALAGALWNDSKKRVDGIELALDGKADKDEVNRHRDYIGRIFEKIEQSSRRNEEGIDKLKDMIHRNHIETLNALSRKADK